MSFQARAVLYSLCAALSSGPLMAQTFTFSTPKSIETFSPGVSFMFEPLDLNGDGNIDLGTKTYSSAISVYLGDGKGGFSSTPIAAGSAQFGQTPGIWPTFMDLNGDGKSDQVFAFASFYGSTTLDGVLYVLLGQGDGNFFGSTYLGNQLPGDGGTFTSALVKADFNGDGMPDLALLTGGGPDSTGASTPAAITLFLNQGKGVFAQQSPIWLQGSGGWLLTAGDFNGDGKQDLAWTQIRATQGVLPSPYTIHYMYGNGNGTFGAAHTYTVDTPPVSLASGDINHDGKTDLVVGLGPAVNSSGQPVSGSSYRIATLLAKQTGGFYWAIGETSGTPTTGLQLIDLNNDGRLDAVYDLALLRAGLSNNSFGVHQYITYRTNPPQPSYQNFPLAPLTKGGLPAAFTLSKDAAGNIHVNVQVNLSK